MNSDFSLIDLRRILENAGEVILPFFNKSDLDIKTKSDETPVTEADIASHNFLSAALLKLTPHIPFLSEESDNDLFEARKNWREFWISDPLDGTKEFIQGGDGFTVNLALIRDSVPVIGLVHAPLKNVTYQASLFDRPTLIQGRGSEVKTSELKTRKFDVDMAKIAIGSNQNSERIRKLLATHPGFETEYRRGPLKFALVAEGLADIYLRFNPSMEWDTAAIQCIVEQAGGGIFDLMGNPLTYNRENMKNPPIFTVGDTGFDWSGFIEQTLSENF